MDFRDPRNDGELVAAANAGDTRAFESLYLRYRDWALRVAWRFTRDRDNAIDIVQEAFLYLLRKFPGFQLTARLTTFLYPVIRNLALAEHRKRVRRRTSSTDELDDQVAPTKSIASSGDLERLLARLPEPQREVLLMRYVDEMTSAEIAAALEIPVGTAKSRLHAAVETLRSDPAARAYFEL